MEPGIFPFTHSKTLTCMNLMIMDLLALLVLKCFWMLIKCKFALIHCMEGNHLPRNEALSEILRLLFLGKKHDQKHICWISSLCIAVYFCTVLHWKGERICMTQVQKSWKWEEAKMKREFDAQKAFSSGLVLFKNKCISASCHHNIHSQNAKNKQCCMDVYK